MLTSLSITERMRLWKKHARQPVEEFIVKMSFIDKTRAQRQNVSILQRNCIEVISVVILVVCNVRCLIVIFFFLLISCVLYYSL